MSRSYCQHVNFLAHESEQVEQVKQRIAVQARTGLHLDEGLRIPRHTKACRAQHQQIVSAVTNCDDLLQGYALLFGNLQEQLLFALFSNNSSEDFTCQPSRVIDSNLVCIRIVDAQLFRQPTR
ncbi:hypothetical protein RRF57_008087 [Xylaria bambusicola]|uniref:Uncharacterized protein n=1 Tax=Xylaria bambusicola TaxID=326684 RepID=A0AAN7UT09_9PEZI